MKKLSIILAIVLILSMSVVAFAACDGEEETISITVWSSQAQNQLMKDLAAEFLLQEEYAGKGYKIDCKVMDEMDVKGQLATDLTTGADVFSFPSDQLTAMARAGYLRPISYQADQVEAESDPGAFAAAKDDAGQLYAYPSTASNGYFLWYDNDYFKETDVATLDGIMAKLNAKNQLSFKLDDGWFGASFFIGMGCTVNQRTVDGTLVTEIDYDNDNGKIAARAMYELAQLKNKGVLFGDNAAIVGGFNDGTVKAAITGTWNSSGIKGALRDKLSVTKLPTFTADTPTGEEQVQMGSFTGYKLIGVNAHTQQGEFATKFARYITTQEAQLKRYEDSGEGPTNKAAAASDLIKADPILSAFLAQSVFGVNQRAVPDIFFTQLAAFAYDCSKAPTEDGAITLANIDEMLAETVTMIREPIMA